MTDRFFDFRWQAFALGLAVAVAAPAARAQRQNDAPGTASTSEQRLVFGPRYRPFQWPDAVQTAVTLGLYLYVDLGVKATEANWRRPILFDGAVRDALVAQSSDGRNDAAFVSDVTWYVPMMLPFIESIALPLFTDDWNWHAAFQMTALNVQATSVVALFTRAGHHIVARERPDVEPCQQDPDYNETCFGGSFSGFPSGHASAGLLGAGLSCAHHTYLPLLGGGAPDVVVCVAASALGVTSGVMRIIGDRHYASDVIAGSIVGWGAGFFMPALLHYQWFSAPPANGVAAWAVTPLASADTLGVGALAVW